MDDTRLPVTVLTGLSAALREQAVLAALRARTACAAVVYDVEPALGGLVLVRRVLDARGEHDRTPVELQGCCLACSVRADVGDAVDLVTGAGRWREVVLSLPASLTPRPVAAALAGSRTGRPDTLTAVVDAVLLEQQLQTDDLLADRGLAAAPTDRRSTADVLLEQVEEADVLVVAGSHRLLPGRAETVRALLAHLAPLAVQVLVGADGGGADAAVSTGRHDPSVGAGQREELATLAAGLCPPRCGVVTTVWTADRPLHPERLYAVLRDVVGAVVRSRGSIALLGRDGQQVRWESAGPGLSLGDPEPASEGPACRLLLTGTGSAAASLTDLLDGCLARPGERCDDDPFEAALGPAPRTTGA